MNTHRSSGRWATVNRPGNRHGLERSGGRGAVAVELALLLPFLVLIAVYAIDFGVIFFGLLAAGDAATNASYFVVYQNNGDNYPYAKVEDAAKAQTETAVFFGSRDRFTVPPPTEGVDSMGNGITTVVVEYDFTTITQYFSPNTTHIHRQIVVRQTPSAPNPLP